jgi:hypothetical protein
VFRDALLEQPEREKISFDIKFGDRSFGEKEEGEWRANAGISMNSGMSKDFRFVALKSYGSDI